jgi:hypothetical protein
MNIPGHVFCFALLALVLPACAGVNDANDQLKDYQTQAAKRHHDAAVAHAADAYLRALIAADRAELADLDTASKASNVKADTAEMAHIQAAKDALSAEITACENQLADPSTLSKALIASSGASGGTGAGNTSAAGGADNGTISQATKDALPTADDILQIKKEKLGGKSNGVFAQPGSRARDVEDRLEADPSSWNDADFIARWNARVDVQMQSQEFNSEVYFNPNSGYATYMISRDPDTFLKLLRYVETHRNHTANMGWSSPCWEVKVTRRYVSERTDVLDSTQKKLDLVKVAKGLVQIEVRPQFDTLAKDVKDIDALETQVKNGKQQ